MNYPDETIAFLWNKIRRNITVEPQTGCWRFPPEYGDGKLLRIKIPVRMRLNRGQEFAYVRHVAWQKYVGVIPSNTKIWRKCSTSDCIRPSHQELKYPSFDNRLHYLDKVENTFALDVQIDMQTGCWLYHPNGRRPSSTSDTMTPSKVSWILYREGPDRLAALKKLQGFTVWITCGSPLCVNPLHLVIRPKIIPDSPDRRWWIDEDHID